jgi:hypothetical protein
MMGAEIENELKDWVIQGAECTFFSPVRAVEPSARGPVKYRLRVSVQQPSA